MRTRSSLLSVTLALACLTLPSRPASAATPGERTPTALDAPLRPGIRHAWDCSFPGSLDLGWSVSGAGDVNGDGWADVLVADPSYSGPLGYEGRVVLFHGSPAGLAASPDWDVLGDQAEEAFGAQVCGAGDVNGDGYDDVLVGSDRYAGPAGAYAGRARLYLGSPGGLSPGPAWSADGEQASAFFGNALAPAGDVDGDGYDDLVIGSYGFDGSPASSSQGGRAYLYRGSASGPGATPDWTATGDDFPLRWQFSQLGIRVDGAGDVNGDGFADVVVSGNHGVAVYLGSAGGLASAPVWTSTAFLQIGKDVAGAGDVNGDGYDDLLTSTLDDSSPEGFEGVAVLYLGGPSGPQASWSWLSEGNGPMAYHGWSLAGAGDLNGDGFADVVVGAPFWSNGQTFEGRTSVFLGSASGLAPRPAWEFEPHAQVAHFGIAVAAAGDVDGDGFDDFVVGANTFPNPDGSSGRASLFLGGPDRPGAWLRAPAPSERP